MGEEDHKSNTGRNQVAVGEDFLPREALRLPDQAESMGPQEEELDEDEGAGIDDPLWAQHVGHQRDDQVSCIGIDERRFLQSGQPQRFGNQGDDGKQDAVDCQRGYDCQQETVCDFRAVGNQERFEEGTRQDQIDTKYGEHLAVRTLQKPEADDEDAACHHHEQDDDFFSQ